MSYEFFRWRIGINVPPSFVRVITEVRREEDLDRSVWTMIVNADVDKDRNLVNWLRGLDDESLKKYEELALDIAFTNWTHRRIVFMLFQIAKIFAGSRSKVALFSILIEIGQLVTDLTVRTKNQNRLITPISCFARAMTVFMNDSERALEMNLNMEKFRTNVNSTISHDRYAGSE